MYVQLKGSKVWNEVKAEHVKLMHGSLHLTNGDDIVAVVPGDAVVLRDKPAAEPVESIEA